MFGTDPVPVMSAEKRSCSPERERSTAKRKCSTYAQSTLHNFFGGQGQEQSSSSLSKHKTAEPLAVTYSPKLDGFHVYTDEQIAKAIGMEKEYRLFWNTKAEELMRNRETREKLRNNKSAIVGAIGAAWTLHKTSLLCIEGEEVLLDIDRVFQDRGEASRECLKKTVRKNLEKMKSLQDQIELSDMTETETKDALKRLKETQEALVKSIKRKREDILIALVNTADSDASPLIATEPDEISEGDLQDMIKEILVEDSVIEKKTESLAELHEN